MQNWVNRSRFPVGRASKNESLYILDPDQKLLPIGQVGEICIGGVGVAQGYFNDVERTEEAFLPNPFATQEDIERGWTAMYRTSDLGYLDGEGTLFVQGRIAGDTEMKMNGVRVNLVEIEEAVLMSADGALSEAVACLRCSSKRSLPPSFQSDETPRLASGKVDRNMVAALPGAIEQHQER
ncbi:hypothetical protein E4U53_003373 [Claviceps sorghi]|nr:hypothetical protein E4U53_003373 [Claviceps sorghi]